MTMTTKGKRLANTDIEIPQHALVTFIFYRICCFLNTVFCEILYIVTHYVVLNILQCRY